MPFVLAGGTAGAYYLRLHRMAGAASLNGLPVLTAPRSSAAKQQQQRRILVLAPHCDDETLGVGALIADARRAGSEVTVAFLTNGDGFPAAAQRSLGEVRISPSDYVRFAERRQTESLQALKALGVPDTHVHFLGYPDRGLSGLWTGHWDRRRSSSSSASTAGLFRSSYTGHTHSPYRRAYTPRTPYCGEALLGDLIRLMQTARPTEIYVTHPADDHSDHAAAAAFAQAALWQCRQKSSGAATGMNAARLRYYIVHRGDWPLPQGRRPDRPLLPPPGLAALDTRWLVSRPSDAARAAKAEALSRYESQMAVAGRFLSSFLRVNELVGEMPDLRVSPRAPLFVSAPDAVQDNVVRFANPSADLGGLSVWKEGDALRVRVLTSGPVSARIRYAVQVRGIRASRGSSRAATGFVTIPLRIMETTTGQQRHLEAAVPLSEIGLTETDSGQGVWVAAETRWQTRLPVVDRTGYRFFALTEKPVRNIALRADNEGVRPGKTGWRHNALDTGRSTAR